jgi:hypothetical protein
MMSKPVNSKRNFKASVFSSLFSEYPDELPKIVPVKLSPGAVVEDVTLDDALFMEQINDLALRVDSLLLLFFEHQSTLSLNLALRLLLYAARVYERLVDNETLYQRKRVEIPRPAFFVLYNGKEPCEDIKTMKLSESFKDAKGLLAEELAALKVNVPLELTLTQININKGHNETLIAKSAVLSGYVAFIDRVTGYRESGMGQTEAITKAVRECIAEGILKEYLLRHGSEVQNMLITEWNTQAAIEVARKEAQEEEAEKWQAQLADKDAAIAGKDAAIAGKDAAIAELQARLALAQSGAQRKTRRPPKGTSAH